MLFWEAVLLEYDIIIVGGGASGLIAAIAAARKGGSVLVIERKEKAGKKILATGNGKCNFTNIIVTSDSYRSEDITFVGKVLPCFSVQKTIEFFEALGIYPRERNGYLYPNSEQAASVVWVLIMECRRLRVKFALGEKVIAIDKPDYTVITECSILNNRHNNMVPVKNQIRKIYYGKKLILAAGGCAFPKLGSDGSGYELAKHFGHTVIKPLPALVALKSPAKYCKTLSGIRTTARVAAYACKAVITREEGEIIFTDYGVSGIPIMQLSRYVSRLLDQKEKVHLQIDFLKELSKDEVTGLLIKRIEYSRNKNLEEMMTGLLNSKLSYILIKEAKLMPKLSVQKLSECDIKALMLQIKEFHMEICGTNSFENAQVCAGGVATKEIDAKTMESKKKRNLFFSGELVDVDGTCGGYNLQWAWTSGYLAGTAAGGTTH
jgi:predicted Rossmann fold flavoprotein